MSAVATPNPTRRRQAEAIPPLRDGDRLDREEFHRRYEAMGECCRAELIEGIVYLYQDGEMASPVSIGSHGKPVIRASTWLGVYEIRTPGVLVGGDSSVFLDGVSEPQPDVLLGIPEAAGGQTRTATRNGKLYVASAPELVVEISASTARTDLHQKLAAYARNGVREYVVLLTDRDPPEVRWMTLNPAAGPTPLTADGADGLLKSRVFPGLWLDADALLAGDAEGLLTALDRGLATAEHAAFAKRLAVTAGPAAAKPTGGR